ncbi:MAG: hypothetical protein GXO73_08615 [Calditrichaeota bacterium]|nr:hypothetical protein [Calditrichota bacterium]
MSALVGILRGERRAGERSDLTLLRGVRALRGVRYEAEVKVGNAILVLLSEQNREENARVIRHDEHSRANGRVDVVLGDESLGEALRAIVFGSGDEISLERELLARRTFYFARRSDGALVFSDRIDAVLAMLDREPRLSEAGLAFFLTQFGLPAPWTLVEGIWKIGPGRRVALRADHDFRPSEGVAGAALPSTRPEKLDAADVRELVREALRRRSSAGSNAGILLSGGLDSSIVLSQLRDLGFGPQTAYILRYTDPVFAKYDWDARYAWLVAWKHGLDIENVAIDPGMPVRVLLNRLQAQADEPVADPALIPLFLAARAADRRGLRVLWDGRGADELFAAPHTDANLGSWFWWFRAPRVLRSSVGRFASRLLGKPGSRRRAKWLAKDLDTSVFWQESVFEPEELHRLGALPLEPVLAYFRGLSRRSGERHPGGLVQRAEWEIWLAEQNQPLVETVTRMTGVRFQSPFVDEELVRHTMGVPFRTRVPRGPKKRLLREAFGDAVPREILRRTKRGLGTPAGWWLQQMRDHVRYDISVARETFGDELLRWDEVERMLGNRTTEPVVSWLLVTLLSWVRLHLVEPHFARESAAETQVATVRSDLVY